MAGGSSLYVTLSLNLPVSINGVLSSFPISSNDADISACVYLAYASGRTIHPIIFSPTEDGQFKIRLSPEVTIDLAKDSLATKPSVCCIDAYVVFNKAIADTPYIAGDATGFSWQFVVTPSNKSIGLTP